MSIWPRLQHFFALEIIQTLYGTGEWYHRLLISQLMYILSIFVSIAKNTYQKPVQFGANKTIGF